VSAPNLLDVEDLVKRFRKRDRTEFVAVGRISFRMAPSDSLGLVGETGAGKSTIARCLLGIETPSEGRIRFLGDDIAGKSRGGRLIRRHLQAVFQDPKGAMNPRWTVRSLVGEPLRRLTAMSATEIDERVAATLGTVGLGPDFLDRYRHQLSGGQQQRVNIARAVAVEPRLVVLDEPVAALDSAVKRDVVRLLARLQRERDLSYFLISHDLRVVRILCNRIIVLFRGRIVEMGPSRAVIGAPRHPYTRQLLAAQTSLPGRDGLAAERTEASRWSVEDLEAVPEIGDLVEVEPEHFVAAEQQMSGRVS
jgi:ABC-type glutathione transport system ATPase component